MSVPAPPVRRRDDMKWLLNCLDKMLGHGCSPTEVCYVCDTELLTDSTEFGPFEITI